jgi:putative colanic acid biosynthesis UDP-glucose lipid carrier transferase
MWALELGIRRGAYYALLGVSAILVYGLAGVWLGLHHRTDDGDWLDAGELALKSWCATCGALLVFGYATGTTDTYSRLVVGIWFLSAPVLLCLWRLCRHKVIVHRWACGGRLLKAAIVGCGEPVLQLASEIMRKPGLGFRMMGFYDDSVPAGTAMLAGEGGTVCGTLTQLMERVRAGEIDHVFVCVSPDQAETARLLVPQLVDSMVRLSLVPDWFTADMRLGQWGWIGRVPVTRVHETSLSSVDRVFKRAEDLVLAAAALLLFALPMAAIALGVKLTSPGPVLFKQRRHGLDDCEIVIWKFRTMTVAEDGPAVEQARRMDPRVTRFGCFLRRYSLDELPQFFNVLQGRMSVVGPRPHAVAHNEQYRKLINGYMRRHKVKPGITGLAQVRGARGATESVEKMMSRVDSDMEYIRRWSLGFDLRIVARTVVCMFMGTNAY